MLSVSVMFFCLPINTLVSFWQPCFCISLELKLNLNGVSILCHDSLRFVTAGLFTGLGKWLLGHLYCNAHRKPLNLPLPVGWNINFGVSENL